MNCLCNVYECYILISVRILVGSVLSLKSRAGYCPHYRLSERERWGKLLSQKLSGNANLVIFGRQTKGKESSTWLSLSMG